MKKRTKRELEEVRRKNREKRARWVQRQRAAGRVSVTYWLTAEERKFLDEVVKRLPELVKIDRQKTDTDNRKSPCLNKAKGADTSA